MPGLTRHPVAHNFEEKSGGEFFREERLEVSARCVFVTRYRTDINETDRIVDEFGNAYNIRRVQDIEMRHEWLMITTDLGVAD